MGRELGWIRDADWLRRNGRRAGVEVSPVAIKYLVKGVFMLVIVSERNFMEDCKTVVVNGVIARDGAGVGTMASERELHR
tara:strand:- start:187 stop:426 length:240 start_codon:yes stop_codon:yes gene_type:complete